MILMLWFYISGLVLLVGAEMNAEIEHASPYGKQPGEEFPGQKRKIGALGYSVLLGGQARGPGRETDDLTPATSRTA